MLVNREQNTIFISICVWKAKSRCWLFCRYKVAHSFGLGSSVEHRLIRNHSELRPKLKDQAPPYPASTAYNDDFNHSVLRAKPSWVDMLQFTHRRYQDRDDKIDAHKTITSFSEMSVHITTTPSRRNIMDIQVSTNITMTNLSTVPAYLAYDESSLTKWYQQRSKPRS